jgi:hypothetical protein
LIARESKTNNIIQCYKASQLPAVMEATRTI